MSAEEQTARPRRAQVKIPAEVERKLRRAVDAHLSQHRGSRYELLREHPDFRPYIGLALGETGRKRLTRLIAEVRATAPSLRRGGRESEARSTATEPPRAHAAPRPVSPVIISSADRVAGTGPVLFGYGQLQSIAERRLTELERAIDACINDVGEIVDLPTYLKLCHEQRAAVDSVAKLSDRFQAQLKSARFISGLNQLIEREIAPERREDIYDAIRALAAECGGLVPAPGADQ
jgi:hypothetical protein